MTLGFHIEALTQDHDRKSFSSGVAALDRYLHELAMQDIKRRVSNCFIARDDAGTIAGYYTFAAASIPLAELPGEIKKRLPPYALILAGLIGRLAVNRNFQRQRLGSALIMDAATRAARAEPAIFALIVDARDEAAISFYMHNEFHRFASRSKSLFLPIATAMKALDAKTSQ